MATNEQSDSKPPEVNENEDTLYVFKNYNQHKIAARQQCKAQIAAQFSRAQGINGNEDICISGMSGRFPESDTVDEFAHNLYNNIDMVVEDERRWPFGFLGLPRGSGKIKDISRFDHRFFNIDEHEANFMDSQLRIMLEITFEALWDAGIDPASLAGTNTGVYLGNCFDEYMSAYAEDYTRLPDYRNCFFGLLAKMFNFKGPSKPFDTACASGFSAFHEAVVALRSGQCDRAIVVSLNLCLRAVTQNQFLNLNMISPDGHCKCLDDDANGYAKGEACVVVILQKKPEAKRIYATVVHTKTNCDGYKDLGITYPSFELQRELIEDSYIEAGLSPLEVDFCEAHCTGTQAGDPSEMRAIYESMCRGRTADNPLMIGAIKSVIGHTEASSGMCSLVKSVLCFQRELIPSNLHMTKINHRIEGLVNGILKPVNANTTFHGKYIGMNCFGFGGVNVHVIIRKYEEEKLKTTEENLPRLVTFCGRNEETLKAIYNFLTNNPDKINADFLALLNDVSKTSPYPNGMFKGMRSRGFVLVEMNKSVSELKTLKIKNKSPAPVCYVFTGMGCQWTGMGQGLAQYPTISLTLKKCSTVLKQLDSKFDLMKLLNSDDPSLFKSPINSFVGIATIQACLVDLLEELGIKPDYIVGHSIGELTCAYADKCLTLEETIASAYWRGKCIEDLQNSQNKPGAMAAIGCSWQEATDLCNKFEETQIWPACHNGQDSVTVSGYKVDIDKFLDQIQQTNPGIFARSVDSSGIAFHSPIVSGIQDKLLENLSKLLGKSTRTRTSRWISTTYAEDNPEFTAKYLVDNLIKPVAFCEAFERIPTDAIYVEIAPHHLLQSIIKRNILNYANEGCEVKYVSTLSRQNNDSIADNNIKSVLKMLGMLYSNGLNPKTELLYPKVQYPVGRNTASLHSFIQWKHDRKFTVTQYPDFFNQTKLHDLAKIIDLQHKDDQYIQDHCIDGRILFPATGYLYLVWTYVAKMFDVDHNNFPIMFEDVNLHRATIMPKSGVTSFRVRFIQGTGTFAVSESETVVVTGKVTIPTGKNSFLQHQHLLDKVESLENTKDFNLQMKNKDIYKEFRLRGYDYGPKFQSIEQITQIDQTIVAKVAFKNWVSFVDSMIQLAVIGKTTRGLYLPVRLNMLRCDPSTFQNAIRQEGSEETKIVDVLFDGIVNIGVAPGIEFQGIKANLAPRKSNQIPVEETFEFVAHNELDITYYKSRAINNKTAQTQTDQLKMYEESCAQIAIDFNNNNADIDNFKKVNKHYEQMSKPVLFNILNQLKTNKDLATNEITQQFENLEEDLLFRTYLNERFLRSQLETVCENILEPNIQVVEVNQTPCIMAKTVLNWLSLSSFKMTFTYRLVHSTLDKLDSSKFELTSSQHDWMVEKSKFPSDLAKLDLIVYKDSSLCPLIPNTHKTNMATVLESMGNTLAEDRFALIILRDRLFPVEQSLLKLSGKYDGNDSRVEELKVALKSIPTFQIIGQKSDQLGVNVFLIRKMTYKLLLEEQIFMPITNDAKEWFTDLQNKLREFQNDSEHKYIWLLANQSTSGAIGLVSCLRKEPMGSKIRCILSIDNNKFPLDTSSKMIQNIIKLNLYTNAVDKNGLLGSFKHFTLPNEDKEVKPSKHCFLNSVTRGDLSSLRWFEAQHKFWPENRKNNQQLCTVYYSALNFRDIMLATGKLPPDALPDDMGLDDCILGFEFSGRDEKGNRVMGIISSKGLATTVVTESTKFLWPIPAKWTMEEASTVPVVYATAYYALIIRGKLQPNEKVLIHSGSGGVGQASIAICLHYNCQLFITVGSEEKRNILMQLFPSLKPHQFASSRNTDFEKTILQSTNGQGVDIVLNSLAEEKLQSSVNCLAPNGRFLEIGKFDLSQDNKLNIAKIMQNKTFHGILLDNLFNFTTSLPPKVEKHREQIWELLRNGIEQDVVRPLHRQIFPVDKCEEAFRFMASGKHTGKVVICIRPEEIANNQGKVDIDTSLRLDAIPRTVFLSNKSYIVTGGLGGFGLELINWMIEREARKIVITSRTGVKDLYQKTRLDYFAKCGAIIKIVTEDVSTEIGSEKLIDEAQALGMVGGIFHLAMILSDGLFDNQTLASFETVTKPKSDAFIHLDKITRKKCPEIDYFVVFSSVSCGVGNPGQSNYGFANSVMERGCEQRRRDGLHGFAIQWGAIGDVGYIIDNIRGNDVVICGSIPQRIPSCLASLDRLLQSPFSVCSNLIKADFKQEGSSSKASLIKTISHILGLKEYENLDLNVNLGELGMDSLMGVEVKQAIERDYDVILSMQDIRKLTIGKILEIGSGKMKTCNQTEIPKCDANIKTMDDILVPQKSFCYLNDIVNGNPIIFIPQIDGNFDIIIPIAKKLNRPAIGINWTKECKDLKSVSSVATYFISIIETILPNSNINYDLVGYSFGGIIAIEMGLLLQKHKVTKNIGLFDKLILLDSSPKQFKLFTDVALRNCSIQNKYSDEAFVESILMFLMDKLAIDYGKIKEILINMENATRRIEFVQDLFKQVQNVDIQTDTLEFLINTHYNKMLMLNQYDYQLNSFDGDLMLIRASEYLVNEKELIKEDYWLSEIVTGECKLHILKGDHKTFITENYSEITGLIQSYVQK